MRAKRTLWLIIGILVSTILLLVSTGEAGEKAGAQRTGAEVAAQKAGGGTPEAVSGDRVNINKADIEQLSTLPGIGVKTAERIKQYREENGGFTRLEDLKKVKGIGEKNFEKIRPHITI